MTRVVFPGSFDPVTVGHLSVIERSSSLFSEVHIAIAENLSGTKKNRWSIEQRTAFMLAAIAPFPNVIVHQFSGLLVEFLKKLQISLMIRGIRSVNDWSYESELFQVHKILWPEVEMLFLASDAKFDVVSSTYVREIWSLGGNVDTLVPPAVLELMKKFK